MRSEHLRIVFLLTCAQDYHPQGSTSNTADVFIDNLAEKAAQHLFHRTNVLKTLATFDITSSQLFSKLSVLLLSSGSNFTALSHIKMSLIWKMLQNFHLCFSLASVFLNFPLIPVQFVILDSWFVNLRYFIRCLFRVFVNLKNTEPCNAIKGCCIYKSAIGAHSRLITSPHLYITCSINTMEILDNRNVFKKEKKKKKNGGKNMNLVFLGNYSVMSTLLENWASEWQQMGQGVLALLPISGEPEWEEKRAGNW